jgi:hypothetical protein
VVIGSTKLLKATIGFLAGGQAFSQGIFFKDKRAFEKFTDGNFDFDTGVFAVAITVGVQAIKGSASGVQKKLNYHKQMAALSTLKGA